MDLWNVFECKRSLCPVNSKNMFPFGSAHRTAISDCKLHHVLRKLESYGAMKTEFDPCGNPPTPTRTPRIPSHKSLNNNDLEVFRENKVVFGHCVPQGEVDNTTSLHPFHHSPEA